MATKNVIVKYNCEGQGFPKTTLDQDFENDMKKRLFMQYYVHLTTQVSDAACFLNCRCQRWRFEGQNSQVEFDITSDWRFEIVNNKLRENIKVDKIKLQSEGSEPLPVKNYLRSQKMYFQSFLSRSHCPFINILLLMEVFRLVVYEPSFNQVVFSASHSIGPKMVILRVQVLNPGRFKTVPPGFASLPLSLSLVVAVHHRVDEWHPSAAAWLPPVPGGSLAFEVCGGALQRLEKVDIALCNIVTKEKQANWLVKNILVSLVMGIKLELLRNHAISAVGLIFFWVCMHPGNTSEHDSHSKLTYHMYIRHSWSQLCLYFSYFISSTKRPGVIALKQPKQP